MNLSHVSTGVSFTGHKLTSNLKRVIYDSIHAMLSITHRPLIRYVKLRIAHAPRMPGTFSPPPTSKETASKRPRHAWRFVRDARAVMHVGIANRLWRGKRSRHSRRMHNPQLNVFGKRPIPQLQWKLSQIALKSKLWYIWYTAWNGGCFIYLWHNFIVSL